MKRSSKWARRALALAAVLLVLTLVTAAFAAGSGADADKLIDCPECGAVGVVLSGTEAVTCPTCSGAGRVASPSHMFSTFWALVPPLVAIALALITKEVYSSLFVGIVLGGLFYANFNPVTALDAMVVDGLTAAVTGSAGIFLFLVMLGIMVALINRAGGSAAFGRWAETHIRTRVGAMFATFILGVLIFIDDYFNCLTVGSVMRPITDTHKISRAKLAYLIDATAAPVCMIAPISSWAAAVAGVVEGDANGIDLFVRAIPWNFYSILTFVFIMAIVLMKFDYGSMARHEYNAIQNGDLYTTGERVDKAAEAGAYSQRGRVVDLVLPVVVLIAACVASFAYFGGFWGGENAGNFVVAFANTNVNAALPWGSLIALVFTIVYFLLRRVVTFKEAMDCVPKGFTAMVPAILILTFATALKNMTGLLGAKNFVHGLMEGASAGLFQMLPAIIFLVGCVLAFSTGTSWGTFGILIPIVTGIFEPDSTLFIIGIGACLAGAVLGDHCSPISDTTIMASAGAMCDHVNHVSTQLPYVITVGAVCFVNYILAGLIQNAVICLLIGAVLTVGTLFVLKAMQAKRPKTA